MKGLFLRIITALALLLWAIDMVFPWQFLRYAEENHYTAIQERGSLIVGTMNNPISYFINKDGERGFEYELAKAFADSLGVELEIKTFDNQEQLFNELDKHNIDLAAAHLLYHPNNAERFQIGPAYHSASWQLAYRKDEQRPKNLGNIKKEIYIANNSSLEETLKELQKQYPQLTWKRNQAFTQEELLLQLSEGKIPYVIANSIDIAAIQQIKPELAIAFDITDESNIHWYLPNNAYNDLQAALLNFMNNAQEIGLVDNLKEKYLGHISQFDYVDTRSYMNAIENTLPQFSPLFEKYKGELDWRLLAAIAYQESHWNPDATSPTGVRGIMMLTKDTAQHMKINDRTDPEQSIKAGSEYLHWLISQIPETIEKEERIWFALAAYNMGLGHLIDARRLTKNLGGNPDNWLDVKKNLPLLAEKRYYSQLKYGYARGYEAHQYVENIRRYMNSIVNYHRVQENQTTNDNTNNESAVGNSEEIKEKKDK